MNISRTKKDIAKRKMPFYSTLQSLLNEGIFEMTYFSGHVHFTCRFADLSLTLKCHLQHSFNIRYHLVGQVYSLEELKNLTSFSTASDLMLNITVHGTKVTKLLSILTFKHFFLYGWICIVKLFIWLKDMCTTCFFGGYGI